MGKKTCLKKAGNSVIVSGISVVSSADFHGRPVIDISGIIIQVNPETIEVKNSEHNDKNQRFRTIFITHLAWRNFIKKLKKNKTCPAKKQKNSKRCKLTGAGHYVEIAPKQCHDFCEVVKSGHLDSLIKVVDD